MKGIFAGLAVLLNAWVLSSCSHVDVTYVAPDFQPRSLLHAPVSVVENGGQSGPVAANLAQRLAAGRPSLPVRLGPHDTPLRIVAELTNNHVGQRVDRDADYATEYVYDEEGEIIDSYQVVENYETTARTSRKVSISYRIEEVATGRPLWIAESQRTKARTAKRNSSYGYPDPPSFPEEPALFSVVDVVNKGAAASIQKLMRQSKDLAPKPELEFSSVKSR